MRKAQMREIVFNEAFSEDTFGGLLEDFMGEGHEEYWLRGGRGSTKSSFISLLIVLGIIQDPDANAIIYRRVGNTLKDSVFSQMLWAVNRLEQGPDFRTRLSPLELIYTGNGREQRILFRGADDPMKSKSIKLKQGYFKYLWLEELAEFRGMDDIRTIKQSVFRGVDRAVTFYSYNPPKSAQSWVNGEALRPVERRLVHSSTYLTVPREWLGEEFLAEAEALRQTNERAWRNEYLGEVTGTGGQVFENLKIREIADEEISGLGWFYQGIDWGWFPDPFQWVRCGYDSRRRRLFILDEYRGTKRSNADVYADIRDRLRPDEPLTADSAEPKSVADFRAYGAHWIRGAVKGPGSVDYSMKWLASLAEIVIDSRCVECAKEFLKYEFERNAQGEFVNGYPDRDNHCIDAVRYAMSPVWRRRGD